MDKQLNNNQKTFCKGYLEHGNATRAYMAAYSNVKKENAAAVCATKLLKTKRIKEYLERQYPSFYGKKKMSQDSVKKHIDLNNIGNVYVIHCLGTHYYKIGRSVSGGSERLKSLQTGMPFDLRLIADVKCNFHSDVERVMHKKYMNNGVRGEWFVFSGKQLLEVVKTLNSYG